jgi:PPE-repeat protein
MMDFAALPPEINSALMYSGPGSAPMMAAASAWNGLAAELGSATVSYASVLSALASEAWLGPASISMASAVAPFVSWMGTAAAQAETTAAQAELAAGAFEAAFAATVDPAVIAANRAQLMALIATNFLGQNTPAIAATEAQYMEMWAQDAAAMYGYAAGSAAATQVPTFSAPQQATNPTGLAAQFAAVMQATGTAAGAQQTTLTQLLSAVPSALQGLASPASSTSGFGGILNGLAGLNPFASGSANVTTGLDGLLNLFGGSDTAVGQLLNSNVVNSIFSSGFYMPSNTVAPFLSQLGSGANGGSAAAGDALGDAAASGLGNALAGPLQGVGELRGLGGTVSAGLGNAASIGPMSVPPSWTGPAPVSGPLASSLGGTPMVAPPAATSGMPGVPGMPMGNLARQGFGRAVPQYGFRPTFVAHPPAAG